jgi:outer membrane protein TolC
VDVPLELGGKRAARVTARPNARATWRKPKWLNAQAQVRGTVIGAYFHVLVAQERARIAGSSVELAPARRRRSPPSASPRARFPPWRRRGPRV